MSSNPFTDAYEALWDCLEARTDFKALVKAANRIKFTGTDRDPWDRLANVQSFPAVAILPVRKPESASRVDADSHTTDVEKWFAIVVGGGGQRLTALFDVEFAVLRAMASWRTSVGAVQWNSRDCVLDCAVYGHPEAMDNQLIERGIRGWSTVWTGRMVFTFTTSELAAEDSASSSGASSSSGAESSSSSSSSSGASSSSSSSSSGAE
jgi:uncharacterized membrane protein YgcG